MRDIHQVHIEDYSSNQLTYISEEIHTILMAHKAPMR